MLITYFQFSRGRGLGRLLHLPSIISTLSLAREKRRKGDTIDHLQLSLEDRREEKKRRERKEPAISPTASSLFIIL